MPQTAAIYCRVSTREQADSGTSLDTQAAAGRKFAESNGWKVNEAFVVREDHTGTDLGRPGIARLLGGAACCSFNVLIIFTFDRLYRPKSEGDEWRVLELISRFKEFGVTVQFVDGSVPTSGPLASLMGILRSWNAGEDRRKIIERTSRGRAARVAEGRFLGIPPLGYTKDREMRLIPDSGKAQVVKFIFDTYDVERVGVREIQKRLLGRYPAPGGGAVWYQGTVHRLLSSSLYWSGKHPSGAPCPPLVSEEQGRRVAERLRSNTRLKTGKKEPWPLQGRLTCHCGGTLRCQPGRRLTHAEYYCRNRYSDAPAVMRGEPRCTLPRVPKDRLEGLVLMTLVDALQDPEHLAHALEASMKAVQARLAEYGHEIGPIEEALDQTAHQLVEVDRARIKGRLSKEELDTHEADLLSRQHELESRRAAYGPERLKEIEGARAMLPAVKELLAWAERNGRRLQPADGSIPRPPVPSPAVAPATLALAGLMAILPTERIVGVPGSTGKADWRRDLLPGLLDRLHIKVTMYPDHAEINGTVPVTLDLDAARDYLYASHLPRGLG